MLKQQLENRLDKLKEELASGQKVLADLEIKQANVRETLLRISGAIQVLEEELARADVDTNSVSIAQTTETPPLNILTQGDQPGGTLD